MTPKAKTQLAIVACLLISVAHLAAAANVAPSFTLTVGNGETNGTSVGAWGSNDAGQTDVPAGLTNVVAISAGYQHSLGLRADGTVVAWGTNGNGQATVPAGLSGVAAIAAGFSHNVVLLSNGTVIAWGDSNNYGETNVPAGLSNVVAIAAGAQRSAALLGDGTLRVWGLNEPGLTNLTGVRAFSYGRAHALALLENGTAVALGNNTYGQTNQPAGLTNVMAIAAGAYHNLVLLSNGTLRAWGVESAHTNSPAELTDAVAITASEFRSIAMRTDGTMVIWGSPPEEEDELPGAPPYLAASAGGAHAVVRYANVLRPITVQIGSGPFTTNSVAVNVSPGPGEFAQTYEFILTAADTNLFSVQPALASLGSLTFTPAPNAYGTTTVSVVLMDSGGTAGGGDDTSDALTFTIQIVNGNRPPTIALPENLAVPEDSLTPIAGITLGDPDDPSAEVELTLTVSIELGAPGAEGELHATSSGGVTVSSSPASILTLSGTLPALNAFLDGGGVQFRPATNAIRAVTLTARLDDFGHGDFDVARNSTSTTLLNVQPVNDAPSFTLLYQNVDGLVTNGVAWSSAGTFVSLPAEWTNLVSLAAGGRHLIGLRADGSVIGDERPDGHSAGIIPSGLADVAAIAAGVTHSVALKRDGTVVAWGSNELGRTNVPPGLDDVRAIAAGTYHSLALRSNGTVVAWGGFETNVAYVPADLTNVAAIAAGSPGNRGLDSIALLSNEVVRVWYTDGNGPTNLSMHVPGVLGIRRSFIGATAFALLNNSNMTTLNWSSGEMVTDGEIPDILDIAANEYSIVIMNHNRDVLYLDLDAPEEFSPAPAGVTNVVSIHAGPGFNMAILRVQNQRLYITDNAGPVSILVATNLSTGPADEAGQTLGFQVTSSNPALFDVAPQITSDGVLTFTAASGASGTNVITVSAVDNGGTVNGGDDTSDSQTFTLIIGPLPGTPVVVGITYPTNGVFQAGDLLTMVVEVSEPVTVTGGLAMLGLASGDVAFVGRDSGLTNRLTFDYTVQTGDFAANGILTSPHVDITDDEGNTRFIGTIVNHPGILVDASRPVAVADSATLGEDGFLDGASVLANDTDADTNALTATLVGTTSNGVLNFNADGTFTYTPELNFYGTDSFTYTATDGVLTSAVATVTLAVAPTNDAPTITGPALLTITNNIARPILGVIVDDVDAGTNDYRIHFMAFNGSSILTAASSGGVISGGYIDNRDGTQFLILSGTISNLQAYLAAPNVFVQSVPVPQPSTEMLVVIEEIGESGEAFGLFDDFQIDINHHSINDAPRDAMNLAELTTSYGEPFTFTFATNAFVDPDGDTLRYSATGLPPGLTLNPATRTIAGTPTAVGNHEVNLIAGDGRSPELRGTNSFGLTITKAPLTITADDQSRTCGSPNPAFTLGYSGFRNGDTAAVLDTLPVVRTEVNALSGPGVYPITLTGGNDDNYEFTLVDGTLVITNGAPGTGTVRGTYHGLFYETNAVRHESSGAFLIKATAAGAYSGTLELAGAKLRLSGTFPVGRAVTNVIARKNLSSLTVTLGFDDCDPPQAIFGTVSDGSWTAQLMATPLHFHAKTNPAPTAGRYVMNILGFEGDPTLPAGQGWGTVSVTTAGKLKLAGALADGTKLTDGSTLNEAGLWPFYVPYARNGGAILGWITVGNEGPFVSELAWIRKTQPTTARFYQAGFTNQTAALGLRYTDPGRGTNVFPRTEGLARAVGGNLSGDLNNPFEVGPGNRVTWLGTNFTALTFSPKDGRFKGTLRHNGTGKPATFSGVIHRDFAAGYGFFLGTNQSGEVMLIEP